MGNWMFARAAEDIEAMVGDELASGEVTIVLSDDASWTNGTRLKAKSHFGLKIPKGALLVIAPKSYRWHIMSADPSGA